MEEILEIIATICSLIPTIISIVLLVRNIIKNKNWSIIEEFALEAMSKVEEYAEQHTDMTGDEKLDMAIQSVKAGLNATGIILDDKALRKLIAYIQKMCSWSKTVNK